uniref:Uncharacterized protein n=1 Tax=Arundo donax TaxID=35708 RepID=A0A0A9FCP8_ARUDO
MVLGMTHLKRQELKITRKTWIMLCLSYQFIYDQQKDVTIIVNISD